MTKVKQRMQEFMIYIEEIYLNSEGYNSKDYLKYNGVSTMKKCNNINYNDLSKQFTLEELHTVLDNLEERPSNEDLYNIWNHVLGITKEGFEDKIFLALYRRLFKKI
ncbi:hypothetical protein PFFVO_05465 [Plasmodium falciparum Vietnam Oak-Knoll (FVO)]|nr:hypothetical protein PFFVO_05465 [Plasmodium falciparum Vietnam Oak-Knoll (FVO)]